MDNPYIKSPVHRILCRDEKGGIKMGRDRQERKLKKERRTESDRDQSLDYKGATRLDTPEEAREMNEMNP